ncbi:helix-turn-helix domain-containing protein [Parasedimentitalea maritima]|uniref:Helix-turn-helix domain-containing protein n=2 Tax=Parasedimentitalea maritima TaxID=2578117 RepID=A0A6A4RF85_9RHOB|nr:helix-turn-helix domain-containing protein [Zongyanglinia marina]
MEVKMESQAGVALVAKAFQILDLFQASSPTWSQAEIIRKTDLNRSTVNRLVRFLAGRGYLVQIAYSGRYSLGLSAIELGNRANAGFDLRANCQAAMEELSAKVNETVVLSAFDPLKMIAVCIDQVESRKEGLRVFEKVGSSFPLHAGAAPKAILAFLSEDAREEFLQNQLKRFTANTLTSKKEMRQDIEETRQRGYALSKEETYEGTVGIAAPIFGPLGTAIGSLAVALPVHRATPEALTTIAQQVLSEARSVSETLTGAVE